GIITEAANCRNMDQSSRHKLGKRRIIGRMLPRVPVGHLEAAVRPAVRKELAMWTVGLLVAYQREAEQGVFPVGNRLEIAGAVDSPANTDYRSIGVELVGPGTAGGSPGGRPSRPVEHWLESGLAVVFCGNRNSVGFAGH